MTSLRPPPYSIDPDTMEAESTLEYVRASGPGGQHRNKRETGIRLTHLPSGLVIMATERRSRLQNTGLAFERLYDRLCELNHVPIERVPTKVPKSVQRRRVAVKRLIGVQKASRRKPTGDE